MAILAVAAAGSLHLVDDTILRRLADGELDAGTAARVRSTRARSGDGQPLAGLAEVRVLLSTASGEGAMRVPTACKRPS